MAKSLGESKKAFLEYYLKLLPEFGSEEKLEEYLRRRNSPVLLISPVYEMEVRKMWQREGLTWRPVEWFPKAVYWPGEIPVGESVPGFEQGWVYSLNAASLVPVVALEPKTGEVILDGCAAPGGKTLAIASLVNMDKTVVVANDASMARWKRLRTTTRRFGYPQVVTIRGPVQALPHKGDKQFDKILVDAPCSSEKHVFNSKKYLKMWSPNRSKTLAHLQKLLVETLVPLLKPGGRLVYSTCALAPEENEGVVREILKKHGSEITFGPQPRREGENFDPMFVAVLEKKVIY